MKKITLFAALSLAAFSVIADEKGLFSDASEDIKKKATHEIAEYLQMNKGATFENALDAVSSYLPLRNRIAKVAKISPTRLEFLSADEMPGWTAFLMDGSSFIFIRNDEKYIFSGGMIDVEQGAPVEAGLESKKRAKRVAKLKTLNQDSLITYPAIGKEKASIVVFIDGQIPYSAKLHRDAVSELNKKGVTVRYAILGNSGSSSNSNNALNSNIIFPIILDIKDKVKRKVVWDSLAALDANSSYMLMQEMLKKVSAKTGIAIGDSVSDAAQKIASSNLGVAIYMGVKGTPHIVFSNGDTLGGYTKAEMIIEALKKSGAWNE